LYSKLVKAGCTTSLCRNPRQIVDLVRSGWSLEAVAREFEPSAPTAQNWVRQADVDEGRRSAGTTTRAAREFDRGPSVSGAKKPACGLRLSSGMRRSGPMTTSVGNADRRENSVARGNSSCGVRTQNPPRPAAYPVAGRPPKDAGLERNLVGGSRHANFDHGYEDHPQRQPSTKSGQVHGASIRPTRCISGEAVIIVPIQGGTIATATAEPAPFPYSLHSLLHKVTHESSGARSESWEKCDQPWKRTGQSSVGTAQGRAEAAANSGHRSVVLGLGLRVFQLFMIAATRGVSNIGEEIPPESARRGRTERLPGT